MDISSIIANIEYTAFLSTNQDDYMNTQFHTR